MTDTEHVPGELSQAEKRATFLNDKHVREQSTTYATFAEAFADEDRGGRYGAVNKTTVIGTQPCSPDYPAAPNWALDPSGIEPPLGYSVSDPPPPVGEPHEIERSIRQLGEAGSHSPGPPEGGADVAPASSPPFSDVVESAAPSTSNTDNPDDDPPEAA